VNWPLNESRHVIEPQVFIIEGFECRYTSSEGMSRGKLYITLAAHAVWWSISREFSKSTLGQPPQTTSPYKTDGNIILKYKSNRASLLKNELLFKRFSLLTKFFFSSVSFLCDQESQLSIVTPKRRVRLTHSIRSSPIVTEFSGLMCCFLINSTREPPAIA